MVPPQNNPDNSVSGVWRFKVNSPSDEKRLDQFLHNNIDFLSRGQIRKVIDLGGAHLNGRRHRRCGTMLKVGDSLEVYVDGRDLNPYRIAPSQIVFRDPYLVALNKPAGIETQPTHSRYLGTLYEALGTLLGESSSHRNRSKPIGMIQRLDRDTSGLILFTIHPNAHAAMTRAFTSRTAKKTYLAIVQGEIEEEGEYSSLLARTRKNNLVKSVAAGGKQAITRFKRLYSDGTFSVVKVEPLTGRSHQIRVHLAEAGYPLLGDHKYGGRSEFNGIKVERQQLHAWQLEVDHPVLTEKKLSLSAPFADDMSTILNALGWSSEL